MPDANTKIHKRFLVFSDACEEIDNELRFPSNLRRLDKKKRAFLFDKIWCAIYSLDKKTDIFNSDMEPIKQTETRKRMSETRQHICQQTFKQEYGNIRQFHIIWILD
jgi:hypothetical protein